MAFSSDIPLQSNQLPISINFSENQKEFIQQISLVYKRIADAMNTKEGAVYQLQEQATFQKYFGLIGLTPDPNTFRNTYRTVVNFGALPNTAAKSVAHNIPNVNNNFKWTQIYGAATDPVAIQGIPLSNDGISIRVDNTNVTITTTANFSAFTICTVVIEYSKN